jgi:hypothetical protein
VGYRISGKNLNVRVLVKQIALLLCAALILAPAAKAAGYAGNVSVVETGINRDYPNVVFVRLSVAPTGIPACSSNGYWHFTLSLTGVTGKELYSMLLTAAASGKLLQITGTGTCNEYGQVESVNAITLVG